MAKRLLKIGLVVLVLGALGYWAFRPSPVPADFGTVERGSLQVTVNEGGRTRVLDRSVVSAPVPGRRGRVELERGDRRVGGRSISARSGPAAAPEVDV